MVRSGHDIILSCREIGTIHHCNRMPTTHTEPYIIPLLNSLQIHLYSKMRWRYMYMSAVLFDQLMTHASL